MEFQKHINGLRAIAVSAVLLYHFGIPGFESGFIGVDIFFVISGFLMTKILMFRTDTLNLNAVWNFFLNRTRRIVPPLLLVTSAVTIAFGTFMLHTDFVRLLRSAVTADLFISNLFFKTQNGYFDASAETNPLLHTWSLAVEWQFYLLYPFLVLGFRRICKPRHFSRAILAVLTVSFAYGIYSTDQDAGETYLSTLPRLWEFLAGALVVVGIPRFNRTFSWVIQGVVVIALAASMHFIDKTLFPGWLAIVPVLCSALILADKSASVINRILSLRPFQFFGDISYSLYLWHWPVFSYISMTIGVDRPLTLSERTAGILLSVFLSVASLRFIENKVRLKTGYWTKSKLVWLWVAILIIACTQLAFVLARPNEYKYRLPDYLSKAEFGIQDSNPRASECFLEGEDFRARGGQPTFCHIGSPNHAPQVILWGDSFTDALQPAVDKALLGSDLSGIVSAASGCPPMEGAPYTDVSLIQRFSHCSQGLGTNTLTYIRDHKSLNLVIMHANWERYKGPGFAKDLATEICALKAIDKTVVLIGQIPQPPYDTPHYWANAELKQHAPISEITFNGSASSSESVFKEIVNNLDMNCGSVPVLQPKDVMCRFDQCYSVKDGESLYKDTAHISNAGAALMEGPISNFLMHIYK